MISRQNADLARRAYEAFNAGDIPGWLLMHSPDAALHDLPNIPDAGAHRGHDEIRTWADELIATTEYLRFEPQRFIEAGEDIVVPVRASAKGVGSGAVVEMSFVHVFEFSDGKIHELWSYADEAEALEAARRHSDDRDRASEGVEPDERPA